MPSFEETFWNAERLAKLFRANKLDKIEALMRREHNRLFTTSEEIFPVFLKLSASEELIRLVSKYYTTTTEDLLLIFMKIYYDAVGFDLNHSRAGVPSQAKTYMKSGNLVLALKTLMPDEDSRNAMIVTLAERIHTEMVYHPEIGYTTISPEFSAEVSSLVEKVKTAYARQA